MASPRRVGRAFRWLLGGILLVFFLAKSGWSAVAETIGTVSLPGLGLWCAVNVLVLVLLAARWQVLLGGLGAVVPLGRLTLHRLAGFGVSFLTPGPQFGGEPLQILLLSRREAVNSGAALGSVALDKTLDLLASFVFLAIGAVFLSEQGFTSLDRDLWLRAAPTVPTLALGAYLIALAIGRQPLTWMLARVRHARLVRLRNTVANAERGAAALFRQKPMVMVSAVAISAGSWIVQIGEFWWMLNLLGADASFGVAISLLTLVRLAFLLPLPGGLGVVEAALVVGASALGLPGHVGLAAALMIRARDLSLALIGVLWGLSAIDRRSRADGPDKRAFRVRSARGALRPSPRDAQA